MTRPALRVVGDADRKLGDNDVGAFGLALSAARGQFGAATKALCAELGLAPRGPFIIGLIGKGVDSPHAIADFYHVGRPLITAEIGKLVDAGLVEQTRSEQDGRRITLSLTPAGEHARERLREDLNDFFAKRLAGYSRDEIMLCVRILNDFSRRKD